jgi:2-(1,2-epoxy-1,2-dihydrophenyl)acetyl-CoA isomerase
VNEEEVLRVSYEHLVVEDREEGLLSVELNRPESLNALTREMFRELRDVFLEAGSRSSCRAVLLSGRGRAFCAGADVKGFARDQLTPTDAHLDYKTPTQLHEMLAVMMRIPKPVLAAVHGPAVGAGFPLAAAADLLVAAESAYFALGYLGIGLSPDGGSTFRLPRTLGTHKTFELLALGERLSASDARSLGLVARVFPDESFRRDAEQIAVRLCQLPTRAVGVGKALILRSFEHSVETQLELETQGVRDTVHSRDFREGVRSFVEKRSPAFTGE